MSLSCQCTEEDCGLQVKSGVDVRKVEGHLPALALDSEVSISSLHPPNNNRSAPTEDLSRSSPVYTYLTGNCMMPPQTGSDAVRNIDVPTTRHSATASSRIARANLVIAGVPGLKSL